MNDYKKQYELWLEKVTDEDVKKSLLGMSDEEIKNAFSFDLSFGTAGLRGVMSAGTDRMNVYTVYKATEGIARYMKDKGMSSCAITYDSRINSKRFSQIAAATLARGGIYVYITDECMPTPFLSFIVRRLDCDLGINVTASHNPGVYNGYKVYDSCGCQLTDEAANEVTEYIEQVDMFERPLPKFEDYLKTTLRDKKLIVGDIENLYDGDYTECVLDETMYKSRVLNVAYTPLNGAGYRIVPRVLKAGVQNLYVVPEQSYPDGNFTTCPYPNPEKDEALRLVIKLAEETHADIAIANDPDSDRLGVAVNDGEKFVRLTGNEVGVLLTDYVLSMLKQCGKLPDNAIVVKTIVTSKMVNAIAAKYGVEAVDVLTGFKYIGDVINKLEQKGEKERFVFGFEESCGYLKGTYVRDKDGVIAAALIAECASYYKKEQGKTLLDRLNELYAEFGNYLMETVSYRFEGADGAEIKRQLLDSLRGNPLKDVAGESVTAYCDFLTQTEYDLPKADVMRFNCADGSQLIVRPSGTEPLIKCYITTVGGKQSCKRRLEAIKNSLNKIFAK